MKSYSKFVCQQCGFESASWFGKCPNCSAWNSLVETRIDIGRGSENKREKIIPQKLEGIKTLTTRRIKTGFEEFDRVLGGGIVPGSIILLASDQGIGNSTILLQLGTKLGGLYVSGEESPEQVKTRADRLKTLNKDLLILPETDVDTICTQIQEIRPSLVIVDSIQTLTTSDLSGAAGSIGQVRETGMRLSHLGKRLQVPIFIIGHVTKEGAIAGPMVLEHLVDTVLFLEGERYYPGRTLRSLKNRFGATDEVGVFQMKEEGLIEIKNPSELFLQEREIEVPGSVVVPILEGTRPILIEIQALTVPSSLAYPRRTASGFDQGRLAILVAIISKRLGLPLATWDIFVNIAGGLKIKEPAADLGAALAIISSFKNKPLSGKSFTFGEVGLLGEIRRVVGLEKRIKEAKRLGFTQGITPENIKTLTEAVKKLG